MENMTDGQRQLRTKHDVALAHVARRAVDDLRAATRLEQAAYDDTVGKLDTLDDAALSAKRVRVIAMCPAALVALLATLWGDSRPAVVLLLALLLHCLATSTRPVERAVDVAADELQRCTNRARVAEDRLRAISDAVERAANAVVMQLRHATAAAAQLHLLTATVEPVMADGPPCQPDRLVRALVAAPAAPPSSPDHGPTNPVAGARRPFALT